MPLTPSRWRVYPRASDAYFRRFPQLPPLVAQILYNRGITEAEDVQDFLARRSPHDTDPFQLRGMRQAVTRLQHAIQAGELVAVYGDYDADGVTATALMVQTLTALGGTACHYIPDRLQEGYGLNREALSRLVGAGVRVVLTVDCGIRSVPEVIHGNQLGLDLIVTDHHYVGEEIPPALATINPTQPGCPYPFKKLAGVGLAFKMAQALLREACGPSRLAEDDLLDLVALGTVADIAPLVGENRDLVARGLERLNTAQRLGLRRLMAQAGIQPGRVDTRTIGFGLGPRLNAAGRLESALAAYELLVTDDEDRANQLAQQLEIQNRERQALTQATLEEARQVILQDGASRPLYLISHRSFNAGIVGLVSGRLTEEFYRPTLVAHQGDAHTTGSARSIPEFHITQALDACADLLERYGGHSLAAGFTVSNENLPKLEARLLDIARRELADVELVPELQIDANLNLRGINRRRVEDLLSARAVGLPVDEHDVGLEIIAGMEALRPFGEGNPVPLFASYDLEVKSKRTVGAAADHLKLVLDDGKQMWDAIAFRMGSYYNELPPRVDIAYALEINEWNGRQRLQLNLEDLKPA